MLYNHTGLLLVKVNIILLLKTENNRSGNTLLAEQPATSHPSKKGFTVLFLSIPSCSPTDAG